MNKSITRYIRLALCICACVLASAAFAQTVKWQDLYRVKKKDTIYGIAKKYDITIDELMQANPGMQKPDYTLKKDDQLLIPFPKKSNVTKPAEPQAAPARKPVASKKLVPGGTVHVGVMLPLHNADGDGQRMIEYYRGVLMACDSLKAQGINTVVKAWNVPIDANVQQALAQDGVADCNIIFGPLYTKQVKPMADFCRKHDIKLVIPFSINGDDVATNDHIFQVYQSPQKQYEASINAFLERFKDAHPVFIDCNDTTSRKGAFTFALRKQLDQRGIAYTITNLKSGDVQFAKAFAAGKQNVVVLNTGRSPELNSTLAKLNILRAANPQVRVSMFGYTEWLMYTKVYTDYFYKYEAFIPTTFYFNPLAGKTINFERAYTRWFKSDMRDALPRFAITGYDQAQFFVRGMHRYGMAFEGTRQQNSYVQLQTPLKFKRVGNGGMQNTSFMLVHYKPNRTIESITY